MSTSFCPCCTSLAFGPVASPAFTHCKLCGHRWRQPLSELSASYYETQTARNDTQTTWFKKKIAERAIFLSSLMQPGILRVLEIGCAEGELGAEIKTRFSIVYDGLELSQDAEQAREKLDQVYRTSSDQINCSPYDLIVSFHVLEHIVNLEFEIKCWSRLLATEGQLVIEVPNQSGHPLLHTDQNQEHLHLFTPASLTILLARQGFICRTLSLDNYESPVYPDSIRVVAQRPLKESQQRDLLIQFFRSKIDGKFIAYGIGGDFHNYVAPLINDLAIQALIDSSPSKLGQKIGRYLITSYDPEQHGKLPILVCSIKFGSEIKRHLLSIGIAQERIIGLESVYEQS